MRATALESLRRDIQDGLNSGPATAWDPDEIKQAGRNRRAARANPNHEALNTGHRKSSSPKVF